MEARDEKFTQNFIRKILKGRNCFGNRHKREDYIKMGVKYTECKDRN
jgi:hypothetical protein